MFHKRVSELCREGSRKTKVGKDLSTSANQHVQNLTQTGHIPTPLAKELLHDCVCQVSFPSEEQAAHACSNLRAMIGKKDPEILSLDPWMEGHSAIIE